MKAFCTRMGTSGPEQSHKKHAVIVGAGFAGLAAARRLNDEDCRVTVLEAGDRVGGRAHTAQVIPTSFTVSGVALQPVGFLQVETPAVTVCFSYFATPHNY